MKKVGSREFKNRMGRYLRRVRKGETIVVTDRGTPVAHVCPPLPEQRAPKTTDDILKELAGAGHIVLSTRPFAPGDPVPTRGKPASQIILEDRR